MADGLTVPGRPPTPSDGRAQHYLRIGDPMKQTTRTFSNGTTLTFGPDDQVDTFRPGDAFYEQVLVIECAISDIQAVRDRGRKNAVGGQPFATTAARQSSGPHLATSNRPGVGGTSAENYKRGVKKNVTKNTTSVSEPPEQSLNTLSASIYMSSNRSNSPGLGHPGFSTDTRGPSVIPGQASDHQRPSAKSEHQRKGGKKGRSAPRKKGKEVTVSRPPPARPSMSNTERLGLAQYLRSREILDSTLMVPRGPNESPGPPRCIRINPPSPTNFGAVIDLYGPPDSHRWDPLYLANLNPHSGGMSSEDRARKAAAEAAEMRRLIPDYAMPLAEATNFDYSRYAQGKGHMRQQSDQTIIFFNENNKAEIEETTYAKPVASRYRGYSIDGKMHNDRSETSTPINYHRGLRNNPHLGFRSTPGSAVDLTSQRSSPIGFRHSSLLEPQGYGTQRVRTPPARAASATYYRSMT